jgi:hypothetical protein
MEFCLGEYDDIPAAGVDSLKHHVRRGGREDGEFEQTGSIIQLLPNAGYDQQRSGHVPGQKARPEELDAS